MDKYIGLIKSLRAHGECGICGNDCMFSDLEGGYCSEALCRAAAAAIKELQCLAEVNNTSKWISVEEQLPEEYKDVLCYYEYFRYGDYNCMWRTVDRGYYGDGRWGGAAGQGHKNKVLYWMPITLPPEEKKTATQKNCCTAVVINSGSDDTVVATREQSTLKSHAGRQYQSFMF